MLSWFPRWRNGGRASRRRTGVPVNEHVRIRWRRTRRADGTGWASGMRGPGPAVRPRLVRHADDLRVPAVERSVGHRSVWCGAAARGRCGPRGSRMVGSRGHRACPAFSRALLPEFPAGPAMSPGRGVARAGGWSAARAPLPQARRPRVPGLEGAVRRHGGTRARRIARHCGLPRHRRLPRRCLTGGRCVARLMGLSGTHAVRWRPHGLLGLPGRTVGRSGRRTPAGTRGIRSWLVARPGRRPGHPACRGAVLTVRAAGCTRGRGPPEPVTRSLGPGWPRPVGAWRCRPRCPGRPGRRCRPRRPGRPGRRCRRRPADR